MHKKEYFFNQFINGLSLSKEAQNLFKKIIFNHLGRRTPPLAKKEVVNEIQTKLRDISINGKRMEVTYLKKMAYLSDSIWKEGFPVLLKNTSVPKIFQLRLNNQNIIFAVVYLIPNTKPPLKIWVSVKNAIPYYPKDIFGWRET